MANAYIKVAKRFITHLWWKDITGLISECRRKAVACEEDKMAPQADVNHYSTALMDALSLNVSKWGQDAHPASWLLKKLSSQVCPVSTQQEPSQQASSACLHA